jgi:predicted deacylase
MGQIDDTARPGASKNRHEVKVLPLTTDLNGGKVALTVHRIAGRADGPTLGIVGTVHGNEWFYIEVIRRLIDELKVTELSGSVRIIPVANPSAFGQFSRTTPDDSDTPDLNRAFPGRYTSITERLAAAIEQEILAHCDYLIQYDCGPWGWAIGEVMYGMDYPDPAVNEASRAMAVSYQWPLIRGGKLFTEHPGPKSLAGYAGSKYKIPSILPEIGGSGFDEALEEEWIQANLRGTKGVMEYLDMLPASSSPEHPQYLCPLRARVNPTFGGMLQVRVSPSELGREVSAGQLLGTVVDPYTFEVLEELRSPGDGWLFYVSRSKPVRPGDFAIGVMLREGAAPAKQAQGSSR